MRFFFTFIFCFLFVLPVQAAKVSYDCFFPKMASPEGVERSKGNTFNFTVDEDLDYVYREEKYDFVKNESLSSDYNYTFIQTSPNGIVVVTTVLKKTLEAVQSVHGHETRIAVGKNRLAVQDLRPKQFYGRCMKAE